MSNPGSPGTRRRHLPLIAASLLLVACGGAPEEPHTGHADAERGPHGGRLLEAGDFALEVTIFERGVPPQFRLYAFQNGKPVPPQEVTATVELLRINGLPGGSTDRHSFTASGDFLTSAAEVYEPHSFSVKVRATLRGQNHEWAYDSPEGRSTIAADMAAEQGLKVAPAAAGTIAEGISLYGRIQPNAERLRSVTARFPGLVQEVAVRPGDRVTTGARLAVIESNESLRSYTVTAPIAGTVLSRHVNPGESAGSEALFEIGDFSTVWAELSLFPRDRARLGVGQSAAIAAVDGAASALGRITQVAPLGLAGQPLTARVLLDNAQGQWTPGQFVNAEVTVASTPVGLAVPLAALQRFREWDVVAVNDGDQYQLLPVQLGRRDAAQVEVLAGLAPGARIVVANSYLVKADVEKSGASHDH